MTRRVNRFDSFFFETDKKEEGEAEGEAEGEGEGQGQGGECGTENTDLGADSVKADLSHPSCSIFLYFFGFS